MTVLNKKEIQKAVEVMEEKHNVKILHAVVAGSHQFAMDTPTSDIDIRFIYADSPAWYFKTNDKRNTICEKFGDYDFQGFNMDRSVDLIVKSDGYFYEWLRSDYRIDASPIWEAKLKKFVEQFSQPVRHFNYYKKVSEDLLEKIKKEGLTYKYLFLYMRFVLSIPYVFKEYGIPKTFIDMVCDGGYSIRAQSSFNKIYRGYLKRTEGPFIHTSGDLKNILDETTELYLGYLNTFKNFELKPYRSPAELEQFHMETILNNH